MKKPPLVSVLMPAYNADKYINVAIESILSQTYKNFEMIIIDDNSTDSTWKIIKKYQKQDSRIIAVSNTNNLKLSKTLNKGIKLARGRYIARMDADDISFPNRLEYQVEYMEKHPEIGISGGSMEIINTSNRIIGKRTYHLSDSQIRNHIFKYSPFSHPLVIIRKSILLKVGLYNSEYNPAEDYELYFRIGTVSKFGNLSKYLLKYRIVPKSMTTGATRKMELLTINIRKIYSKNPNYLYKISDHIYNIFHYISVLVFPEKINAKFKIWLFNKIRNSLVQDQN